MTLISFFNSYKKALIVTSFALVLLLFFYYRLQSQYSLKEFLVNYGFDLEQTNAFTSLVNESLDPGQSWDKLFPVRNSKEDLALDVLSMIKLLETKFTNSCRRSWVIYMGIFSYSITAFRYRKYKE